MNSLDYALKYAAHGWPVLPIKLREKTPLAGNGFDHATTDEEIIRGWFDRWPNAGIGIALAPAGLCTIDIDPRNGATATPDDFPATLTARTGGDGWHLVYRVPAGSTLPGRIGAGLDVKHNGYICVEPSIHPSGNAYAWLDWDVLSDPLPAIAEAPESLMRPVNEPKQEDNHPGQSERFDVAAAVAAILTTENYHDGMVRLAAHYAALGLRGDNIVAMIRGLFDAVGDRSERWQERVRGIDAAVRSAMFKFGNQKRDQEAQAGAYDPDNMVELRRADEIAIEAIRWLWPGYLARGKLHITAGAPGGGKTTIALALAATLSCAGRWPDGTRAGTGNVLIWSGEDDPADTLVPRLRAMEADLERIAFVETAVEVDKDGNARKVAFDPAKHMLNLATRIAQAPPALLIIDPIVSAVAGDSHKNAEVRRDLQQLVDLARCHDVAVFGVTHFSKGTQGRDPTERVTGSLAFGALARVVFVASKTKEGRIFMKSKSNIGSDEGGFGYDIEQTQVPGYPDIFASRVLWGAAIEGTAREILAEAEAEVDVETAEGTTTETDEAIEALRDVLQEGEMVAKVIKATMRDAGFTDKVIRLARERLGVQIRRDGYGKDMKSLWSLPADIDFENLHSCPDDPFVPNPPNTKARARMDTEGTNGTAVLRRI